MKHIFRFDIPLRDIVDKTRERLQKEVGDTKDILVDDIKFNRVTDVLTIDLIVTASKPKDVV